MEESPIVGAAPTNTSTFPTTPYAIMDFFFGVLYGSFGYLLSKNRKGDCMSLMLSFGPSLGGYAGVWDKNYTPSVKKFLHDVPLWILHVWGILKMAKTCIG